MTAGLADLLAARAGDAGGVTAAGHRVTWRELNRRARDRATALAPCAGRTVGIRGHSALALVETLAALDTAGATAVLAGSRDTGAANGAIDLWLDADAPDTPTPADVAAPALAPASPPATSAPAPAEVAAPPPATPAPPAVGVLSSGTTGRPHLERWPWRELRAMVRTPAALRGGTWVSLYALDTFAGVQALLHGCAAAGELVLGEPSLPLAGALPAGAAAQVVMATPTTWRRLLALDAEHLATLDLRVASMGGEPADQALLDRLAATLPTTRIAHVYASSELGSLFSVTDGRAGFPAEWLDRRRPSGVELSVRDGVLWASTAPGRPARSTGDAVKVDQGRVAFLGRGRQIVNVGGRKVDRDHVTSVVRAAPGVVDARAYGVAARITGRLIVADVVLAPGAPLDAVHVHCRQRLLPHERPRRIRVVDAPAMTATGKAAPAP